VTLVDAANILRSLDDRTPLEAQEPDAKARPEEGMTTAHLQISQADVVVINKQDLVAPEQLEAVRKRIISINGVAKIIVTEQGKVENLEGWLLDLRAYEDVQDLKVPEKSTLDPTIATVAVPLRAMSQTQLDKLDAWFRSVLWEAEVPSPESTYGSIDVHRVKGRVVREDRTTFLIQGVREVFEIFEEPKQGARAVDGKLVLIGRNLRKADLIKSIGWFVLTSGNDGN